jgi:two-component system, NarL family, sensor histidine kinase UhpB
LALGGLYPLSFERGLSARVLISAAVVAVLLPTLLVTGWLARVSADAERAQIEKNIQQRTHEISAILDREVAGIKGMLTALATSSSLHNGNLQGFHAKASEISQQLDLRIVLYDVLQNKGVLTTAVPFGTPLDGFSFPKPLVDRVVQANGPFVTGAILSPVAKRYGIAVVVPIHRTGHSHYLLSGAISVSKIANVFDLVGLKLPYVATVVDRNGVIVARSSQHEQFVGQPLAPRLITPPPGKPGTLETENVEGVEFRWFHEKSAVTDWTVLVGAPEEVFDTSFKTVSQLLAGVAIALFVAGLVIAYRIGGRFSRAVSELGTVARGLPHQQPPTTVSSNIREANKLLDDLKAASADLRATDAEQRFAIDAAGIGTWSWDLVQRRIVWSQRTREFYQLPPDAEPTREFFINAIYPADRDLVHGNIQRCLHEGADHYELEFRVLTADGMSFRWVGSKGRVERDATGAAVFIHGATYDITERKESEQERSELRRRLMRAQEEERLRLAHELHDQTGQSLTAALLEVKQIGAAVSGDGNIHLRRLREQLEDMGKTVQRIARELRPTALEDLGLRAALTNHLSDWSATYGIASDFHFHWGCAEDAKGIPDEVNTAVYRIAQEALTNIAKHAEGATAVSLIVTCSTDLVQMTIEDNGCGFDPTERLNRNGYPGLGLAGMRERVALVGGSLDIESSRQAGTTIFVRVPLEIRRQVA